MPNARERADWPSERDSAALTVPDPSPSSPERDGTSSVDCGGLDDVYQRAAREIVKVAPPTDPDMTADDIAQDGDFRALVDIIGRDLAAELARVTAERDQARARIAELEAEQQHGEWQYGYIGCEDTFVALDDKTTAAALADPSDRSHILRRWKTTTYGPVTPISDTTGDQQ